MNNWLSKLQQFQQQETTCVMVTVASTIGSTPREVGSRMIVTAEALFGTIGGGNLEFQACQIARDQLDNPSPQHLKRFPLGAGLGQCCGGLVNLLFEPIVAGCDWLAEALAFEAQQQDWARVVPMNDQTIHVRLCQDCDEIGLSDQAMFIDVVRNQSMELTLFGAGHVGRAIIDIMANLPLRVRWVDSREQEFPLKIPENVEVICTDIIEAEVDDAKPNSCFLVMTHDHSLDQALAEQILKRNDFSYFGLIGSNAKRRMFETRMQRRGFNAELFEQMTCPIGINGIHSKQPAVIAISVAAQIMQVYDKIFDAKQQKPKLSSTRGKVHGV